VAPPAVVEDLDVFEDGVGALLPGVAGTLIDVQNPCGATVYQESNARWVGIYTNYADPTWLCPNPGGGQAGGGCPAAATKPCS
jgi:hypothetical protein